MNPLDDLRQTVLITGFNSETGFCAYDSSHYSFTGLVSEIGEVADVLKKIERNDGGVKTPARQKQLIDEIGDVLWYLQSFALANGFNLTESIAVNTAKLNKRLENNEINERKKS